MCVEASAHAPRTMGCGKSRLRSPENSDVDLKKNNSNSSGGNSSNNSSFKSNKKNSRNGSGKSNSSIGANNKVSGGGIQQAAGGDGTSAGSNKNSPSAQPQTGKKKKLFGGGGGNVTSGGGNERKNSDKEKELSVDARPPASKKTFSNGKPGRPRERNDEIGVSPSRQPRSPSTATGGVEGGERANGGNRSLNKPYLLEVPNEIPSTNNTQSKTAMKDFKSLTASKIVHVTKSQIEFFKMLDEKIERGEDYVTSGNASEVSSLCDFERH